MSHGVWVTVLGTYFRHITEQEVWMQVPLTLHKSDDTSVLALPHEELDSLLWGPIARSSDAMKIQMEWRWLCQKLSDVTNPKEWLALWLIKRSLTSLFVVPLIPASIKRLVCAECLIHKATTAEFCASRLESIFDLFGEIGQYRSYKATFWSATRRSLQNL